jgi:hypothetical protein
VHGKELVVRFRIEEGVLGPGELDTHHDGVEPAQQEKEKGGGQDALADGVVLNGAQPAQQARGVGPQPL